MDKNTIIGFVLIFLILLGFGWLNRPSQEELERAQHQRDSIAAVQEAARLAELRLEREREIADSLAIVQGTADSTKVKAIYGEFASAAVGEDNTFDIDNGKITLTFSSRGGRVVAAKVNDYFRYDSLPMMLFNPKEANLNFTLFTNSNRILNTESLFFVPEVKVTDEAQVVTMRLVADSASYLDFIYTIPNDEYMTKCEIVAHNLKHVLSPSTSAIDFNWDVLVRQNEKGRKFESRYATLNYKFVSDAMDKLSETKSDSEDLTGRVKWVAFKDQFFSSIMIADEAFTSTHVSSEVMSEKTPYIKHHKMEGSLNFDVTGAEPTTFYTYYGPNKYSLLRSYDKNIEDSDEKLKLHHIIPMGWKLFRWVSTGIIIPLFDFFGKFITNYGLIILLMTIVIKLVILPFTYKSYMSSAKMRVLRPQIEEINARIPAEKAMERQQATMELYNKVGVSPMSGCLPMLFQMPILFAMFSFFPTAFELRGQSFLWADDLSAYDAIFTWDTYIPLITPYFGNHISLFCLLMTVTNIIYTKINMANNPAQGDQMAVMKWMMYLMPVMFMFIFNNYASGLSYYYFVSLLITILQTYLFRLFINEDKLLQKLEARKGKPQKKSGFMARLEAAQKAQQQAIREQQQQMMKGGKNSKGRH